MAFPDSWYHPGTAYEQTRRVAIPGGASSLFAKAAFGHAAAVAIVPNPLYVQVWDSATADPTADPGAVFVWQLAVTALSPWGWCPSEGYTFTRGFVVVASTSPFVYASPGAGVVFMDLVYQP